MGTSPQLYALYEEDVKGLINTQVVTANYVATPVASSRALPDESYGANEDVWKALLPPSPRLHANLTVTLSKFSLFDWFPRSPGLYHTPEAAQSRRNAEQFSRRVPVSELLPAQKLFRGHTGQNREFLEIFEPYGKLSMLKGGIGCIHLRSKRLDSGEAWFMSASSSGIAHEGFPVALPDHLYQRYFDQIQALGALRCDLHGKLQFLPDPLVELYRGYRGVPQLYLLVDQLEPASVRTGSSELLVTVGIGFLSSYEGQEKMYASYATFDPSNPGAVDETAAWLEETYVQSLYQGSVATDFDEHMLRFANATFSLNGLMRNELNRHAVQAFVNKFYIQGADAVHLFAGLTRIQEVHIERIEKMEQHGGVNISGSNISVGGDFVGHDKTVISNISTEQVDNLFRPVEQAVRVSSPVQQAQAEAKVDDLKKDVAICKNADDSVMAKLVDGIVGLVPSAVSAIVSAFATPILGGIAGPVTKFALDKIQGK
jgi:hypothetical protein